MEEPEKESNLKSQLLRVELLQECGNIREASLKWAMQEFLLKQSPDLYPEYPEFVQQGNSMSSLLSNGFNTPSPQFFSFLYNLLLANAASAGAHLQLSEADIEQGWLEYHSQGFERLLWEADFKLFKRTFLVAPYTNSRGDVSMFDYLKWAHQFSMFHGDDQNQSAQQNFSELINSDDDEDSDEDPDYRPANSAQSWDNGGSSGGPDDILNTSRLLRNNAASSFGAESLIQGGLQLDLLDNNSDEYDEEDDDDDELESEGQTTQLKQKKLPRTQSTSTVIKALGKAKDLQSKSSFALQAEKKNLQRDLLASRLLASTYKSKVKKVQERLQQCRNKIIQYELDVKRWNVAIRGTSSETYFKKDAPSLAEAKENDAPEGVGEEECTGDTLKFECFPEVPSFLSQEEINKIVYLAIYKWVKVPGRRRIYNRAFQLRVISLLKTYRVSNVDAPLFLLRTWALWCGFLGDLPQDLTISSRTLEGKVGWVSELESIDPLPVWNSQLEDYASNWFRTTQFNWSWQGRNVAPTVQSKPVQKRMQRKSANLTKPFKRTHKAAAINCISARQHPLVTNNFDLLSFPFS